MNKLNIPVVLGTGREGRLSSRAAQFVFEQAKEYGFDSELVDVRDFSTQVTFRRQDGNKAANKWAEIVGRSDGLIIVSPEYNHGYPGELKILLDSLFPEYARKPVAICGVSDGSFGGSRMIEQLLPVLVNFRMVPVMPPIYFTNVDKLFDANGSIKDPKFEERLRKTFSELKWFAERLQS